MLKSTEHGILIKLSLFLLVALILSDFSDILTRGPEASRNMSDAF